MAPTGARATQIEKSTQTRGNGGAHRAHECNVVVSGAQKVRTDSYEFCTGFFGHLFSSFWIGAERGENYLGTMGLNDVNHEFGVTRTRLCIGGCTRDDCGNDRAAIAVNEIAELVVARH